MARHRNRADCRVALGKIVIQPGKMTAQHLGRLRRSGYERSVDAAAAKIGANTHPAQRGILKPGLGMIGSRMSPAEAAARGIAIECGKCIPCGWRG